jgi:DTW domain-containing protein YfiP
VKKGVSSSTSIIPLCIDNVYILRGDSFDIDSDPILQEAFRNDAKPLLVYPGKNASNIEDIHHQDINTLTSNMETSSMLPTISSSANKTLTFIFADGTWYEARKVIYRSPGIVNRCTQVKFSKPIESIIHPIR